MGEIKLGKTLKDLQKEGEKQSKRKDYLGWFQSFNSGESPINNIFFNMGTGPAESPASTGATADGGIGAVGAVGESLEMNEDMARTYLDVEDPSVYKYIDELGYDGTVELGDGLDQGKVFGDEVTLNQLQNDLYDEYGLYFDILEESYCEDVEEDNSLDESNDFIKKVVQATVNEVNKQVLEDKEECDCDDVDFEEEYMTKSIYEDLDSEDPEIIFTQYEDPSKTYLNESYDNNSKFLDADRFELIDKKSIYDADGFTTDYCLYYDSLNEIWITIFGDSDVYTPENTEPDVEFDSEEEAMNWFNSYNGLEDEEDFDECLHSEIYLPSFNKKSDNPYGECYDYNDHHDPRYRELNSLGPYEDEFDRAVDDLDDDFEYNDDPLYESEMSELDIDLKYGENFVEKLKRNIEDLEKEVKFLKTQAPREIRKGGAFDSQEEIDDALEATIRELNREKAKLAIIERRG